MPSAHRSRRFGPVSALVALTLAAGPAAAQASAEACEPAPTSKTFLPWVDPADYVLAPDGDLEAAGAWALHGGAAIVDGNEPFQVGGSDHASSLRIPAGASAATEPMCVGIEHPTLRFFAKRESTSPLGVLRVEALVTDEAGRDHALPIALILGSRSWAPTLPLPIVVNTLALVQDTTQVAFRFSTSNGSQWSIDDVYVDPYRTN